jgi:predicted MFS family arabinose efflux permease
MRKNASRTNVLQALSGYQRFVVAILAFLQFTIVLDFMILAPLGATLMPSLRIEPPQFALVVSAYAFSAGLSGLLTAGFADRFDRKHLLLCFYAGFILGTLLCGLAPTYHVLLIARMITGAFSGVIGSIVLAIAADLFAVEARGRVMGVVQTAYAVSQVAGIPLGLLIANRWGWNATFLMVVAASVIVGVLLVAYLRPINDHLRASQDTNAFGHFLQTITRRRYLLGFATTALLSIGAFLLWPFMSLFTVHNLGVRLSTLPTLYMVIGVGTIVAGPIVGRLSDRLGSFRMFAVSNLLVIAMVVVYSNLGVTPLTWIICVSVLMFIGISARGVASSALISTVPQAADRGSYMSVNASVQQAAGGIASVLSGFVVVEDVTGHLQHFDKIGTLVAATSLVTLATMYRINRQSCVALAAGALAE